MPQSPIHAIRSKNKRLQRFSSMDQVERDDIVEIGAEIQKDEADPHTNKVQILSYIIFRFKNFI